MQAFYLHGFASSARSTKATFFSGRLASAGVQLFTPDFNEPDFETITIARMVSQVTRLVDDVAGPVVLIGSSLGAFVALQAAVHRISRIRSLVLLAPALEFGQPRGRGRGGDTVAEPAVDRRLQQLGDRSIEEWRRTDCLQVFHYGFGRMMPVRYALYEDAARYDASTVQLPQPIQVFQGRNDTAVDPDVVRRWSEARPNVELHMLDDDHQLLASLDYIWEECRRFLGLQASYQQIP
jgi:pimeloyl-ACP methyl ester carboxylesterase